MLSAQGRDDAPVPPLPPHSGAALRAIAPLPAAIHGTAIAPSLFDIASEGAKPRTFSTSLAAPPTTASCECTPFFLSPGLWAWGFLPRPRAVSAPDRCGASSKEKRCANKLSLSLFLSAGL